MNRMLINGNLVEGQGELREVLNPYSSKKLGSVSVGTEKDLAEALNAAEVAFDTWKNVPRYERQALLRNMAQKFRDRQSHLVELLIEEIGKPLTLAQGEVSRLIKTFELAADSLFSWGIHALPADLEPRGIGYRITEERFPLGTILALTPYNWPYNLAAHKIAPAIAVGATIVVKPSPKSLLCNIYLGQLIHEAGCPPGVVNVVDAPVASFPQILNHPAIKVLSFTGSAEVGWNLKKECPPNIPVTLELGGNAFAVVMDDGDIEWAIERILPAAFGYAGQVCISIQHIIVHKDIYMLFKDRLLFRLKQMPFGDPSKPDTVSGPLINMLAADRIDEFINSNKNYIIHQYGRRAGTVVPPTIIECDVNHRNLPGIDQELFGPVATLSQFRDIQEAIDLVNASPFGIQVGIFTNRAKESELFYQNVNVGGVIINDTPNLRFDWFAYGGEKRSGFGREGITYAMDAFSSVKCKVERY